MVVIDASVRVSFYKNDDKFHEQANNILRSLDPDEERILVPAIAFTEVAGVIKRTSNDDNVAWETILNMKDMVSKTFVDFAKLEPVATKIAVIHAIRGADAYYLAVAEITRSKLYTFDEQQGEVFEKISQKW